LWQFAAAKLPDPSVVNNTGSFFANPVISGGQLAQLQADHDTLIPHWSNDDGSVKLAAAWLIEQAGFKDYHDAETGMGTWPRAALGFSQRTRQQHRQSPSF